MKITMFGAGSIGGHMAGRLMMSGQNVNIVARGEHLAALRQNGLTLKIEDQTHRLPVSATDKGDALGPQDLVIVAVKSNQLPAAAEGIRPLVGLSTHVLFIMNGLPPWFLQGSGFETPALRALLDPESNIASIVPADRIIWGVINSGGTIEAPGVIRSTTPKNNVIKLGSASDTPTDFVKTVAEVLANAGYTTEVSSNIRRDIWQKLTVIVGMAMTAAVLEWDNRATIADPETRGVVIGSLKEMAAIGKAIGIEIPANFEAAMDPAKIAPHRSSFLQDLEAKRPVELASTILAAREIARSAGVDAPHVTTIAALIDGRSRRTQALRN
jgi:2-dehydropantoate 2-reductase